tara:strand:- start:877 stop:1119 length:243 start_codon:yes stop_codon:yes gene_type:complete
MIIGAIIEVDTTGGAGADARLNGAAMMQFFTLKDAVVWAKLQSEAVTTVSGYNAVSCVTTVINSDTEQKRWWFNGTEYTG